MTGSIYTIHKQRNGIIIQFMRNKTNAEYLYGNQLNTNKSIFQLVCYIMNKELKNLLLIMSLNTYKKRNNTSSV